MSDDDKAFEQRARASLDESVNRLDADTRQRLASIRRQALRQQPGKALWTRPFGNWVPASALAVCGLLVLTVVLYPQRHQMPDAIVTQNQSEQMTMLDLFTSGDDLETMSDPDFYAWLDEVLVAEEANSAG